LGKDPLRDFVMEDLHGAGIRSIAIVDSARPTVNKNAIVVGATACSRSTRSTIRRSRTNSQCDDQVDRNRRRSGRHLFRFPARIFNRRTIPNSSALSPGAFKVATARWRAVGQHHRFQGFDLITQTSASALLRWPIRIQACAARLPALRQGQLQTSHAQARERGMLVCRGVDHESLDSFYVIDSFVGDLVDPVAAGDALSLIRTLSCWSTATMRSPRAWREWRRPANAKSTATCDRRRHAASQDRPGRKAIELRVGQCASSSQHGVQGPKRRKSAAGDFVCFVDPFRADAHTKHIEDVPLGDYDAVLAASGRTKAAMLATGIDNAKSVLVESRCG